MTRTFTIAIFAVVNIKPTKEINSFKTTTTQEDQKQAETRRRVGNYLQQNQDLLLARASRPHGFDCEDNQLCEKEDCWKFVPDKIVSEPYEVDRQADRYREEMKSLKKHDIKLIRK